MARYVPDEIWRRLDPDAGRLSRRTTRRLWVAVAVAAALAVAGTLVWRSGLVVPQLVWPGGLQGWEQFDNGVARVEFTVRNAGLFPVTILRLGRSTPGLELLRVEGEFPATLQPGEVREATLVYRITDCQAALDGSAPVTATVKRPWGSMTVDVREDPRPFPWQEHVVNSWCDP